MLTTADHATVVESRPADESANNRPAFMTPEWIAHRSRVLALPLRAELQAFVKRANELADLADDLADKLTECDDAENPFTCPPSWNGEVDRTDYVVADLQAFSRVVSAMIGPIDCEL